MTTQNLMRDQLKALLFDLDGTLLDSFSVHYEVYELMFAQFGIRITKEKFLSTYSPDWYQTYLAMGLPREDWERANSYWVEEAEKRSPELFPGIREALALFSESYMLGLVTSGSKKRVLKDIERTGIRPFFKTIVTGNDVLAPKPSPEALELALRNLEVRRDEVAYIGDAHADFEMAKKAGIRFIGVNSDFASLSSDHKDYKIYSITELTGLLAP